MNDIVEQSQPKTAYERLKRRHQRFVDEHVAGGLTATEALKAAGIGRESRHANKIASRLIREPDIAQAIQERTAEVVVDMGVRHVRVIQELHWLATCDPRKLVNGEGVQIPLHELPADIAACISSVEIENISYNDETGTRYKYRFWDKNKALDKLGQYLKLWDAKGPTVNVDNRSVTINNAANGAEALQGAVRLLEQVRAIAVSATATASDQDRLVLPVAVRDESKGYRASLDAGEDS